MAGTGTNQVQGPRPKVKAALRGVSHNFAAVAAAAAGILLTIDAPTPRAQLGTYTPLCLLAMDEAVGRRLLIQVWMGAGAGIIQSMLSKGGTGSKVLSAALYVALGWIALPYSQQMRSALGPTATGLVVGGGVIYSLGAVIYAAKWPDPYPEVFGYHELFHAAVVLASILHFAAVRIVINTIKDQTCAT